jgi:hypothetical protein
MIRERGRVSSRVACPPNQAGLAWRTFCTRWTTLSGEVPGLSRAAISP